MKGLLIALVVMLAIPVYADELGTSFSVRNPKQDFRVVGVDTLSNGADYEVAFWVVDNTGPLQGSAKITEERESGEDYFGHTETAKLVVNVAEVGWTLDSRPDDGVDAHRIWAQYNRFWGIVGIGVTYQRLSAGGQWQLMSRTSVSYSKVDSSSGIGVLLSAVDERNTSRVRQNLEAKLTGLSRGRVEIRPVAIAERIKVEEVSNSNYRAKVEMVVKL